MSTKNDLHDDIIRVSSQLFMKQSYAATSIKQIADAAGCTTAALYYHFQDGKDEILRAVLDHSMPDLIGFLDLVQDAPSLHELCLRLGLTMLNSGSEMLHRTRWLMVEFPNMGQEERTRLHRELSGFHRGLADLIERFVESRREAEMVAWVQFSALFGYGQLFVTLDLASFCEAPGEEYIRSVANIIGHVDG